MEQKNSFDIRSVKVCRTTEATALEATFAITAVTVWGLTVWMVLRAPDVVPTHFDGSGTPNAYGSPTGILIPCAIVTVAALACMVVAYFPRFINMPFTIANIRQVEIVIRSTRLAGITLMLVPLAMAYMLLVSLTLLPVIIVSAALILNIVASAILSYRAR